VTVTVRELAEWVRGEVLGDGELPISNARTLAEAQPGDITFVEHERHLAAWHSSRASAAVVPASVPVNGRPVIRVSDPLMAFVDIVRHLRGRPPAARGAIDTTAHVHPTARLGPGVTLGPFAVVGEGSELGADSTLHAGACVGRFCTLGAGVTLHPHAVVYDECVLGNRVTVHANAVVGADGFGYRTHGGRHVKVPQLGWVEIEDDVEIGACSTIDRGTFGPTRIGAGTKIDNLVMVGHNCQVGRHNIFCSQVGIAGSVTTGDYVVMAGQVGIADHLTIGDRTTLLAQTGVAADVPADSKLFGTPALPYKAFLRNLHDLDKVGDLRKEVKQIKHHLGLDEDAA
jgi:UDP-3-O-[3-hydroxymyristoyl] glucosamine N-acyltransferase